ncbi:SDR family NAD(P)-dependent oxidoreductase [Natrialbaceae archaeon A-gly3]
MGLTNQTAIVTGGGSDIGAATCRVLADRGADVIVADTDTDGGEAVAEEITEGDGGDATLLEVDVSDEDAVEYAPEIRANTVCLGVVETPVLKSALEDGPESDVPDNLQRMIEETPLGMADPKDIARAIAFLASEDAAFVTGATIPVDGGFTAR